MKEEISVKKNFVSAEKLAITFVFFFMLAIFAGYVFSENTKISKQNNNDLEKLKKNSAKLFFDVDTYKKREMKKYIDVIWEKLESEIAKGEIIIDKNSAMFNVAKENIALIIVDLNDDGKEDIIASIVGNSIFCGKFGRDCSISMFVSLKSEKGYREIRSCMSVFWEEFPVYVLNSTTNGLRDIILNDEFILKFNGKEYCFK